MMHIMSDQQADSRRKIPSPHLVAAWLTLDTLPTERVPLWAAYWMTDGCDGPSLIRLAGLSGADPHEVRDVLPAALSDCGVSIPESSTAAAMTAFTDLARLHADGRAGERWIVDKVSEIVASSDYSATVTNLPLGWLYGLDDEWGHGWGRGEAELAVEVGDACRAQLVLAENSGSV
jgi:hypothetical protein